MNVTVYCGSRSGINEIYKKEAQRLGAFFAKNDINLIFGGGSVGLMGAISKSVMENGGKAYGVIPKALQKREVATNNLTKLFIVDNMHTRKALMSQKADAFIAMAGGIGTMEELFEIWTWLQLGYHKKPCAIYNINGFYDKFLDFIDKMIEDGFLPQKDRELLIVKNTPESLLKAIKERI